jgi:hypothetical protein
LIVFSNRHVRFKKKKRNQARTSTEKESDKKNKKKESYKNSKKRRIRQEFKNTRILPGEAFLASSDKILSTRISPEVLDLFFQARVLYRKNGERILADNPENQEPGKTRGKIVD